MHWRRYVPPKHRLTSTALHGISQRTNLSSSAADKRNSIVKELYEIEFKVSRKHKTGSTVDSSSDLLLQSSVGLRKEFHPMRGAIFWTPLRSKYNFRQFTKRMLHSFNMHAIVNEHFLTP
jgi:hypothetical protein